MSKRKLTAIGECMVELSSAGEGLYRKGFAGDVVNTLWYARKALPSHWSCSFFTGLGTDAESKDMRAFLATGGVETEDVLEVPGRVPGLYMIHLDGAERSFSYWRDTSAAKLLASDRSVLGDILQGSDCIYFSGITLAILSQEDVAGFLEALSGAKLAGKTIAFDPNIRPRLWDDAARMCQTISAAAEVSTLVMPSFDDEAAHFGDENPVDTAMRYGAQDNDIVVKNGEGPVLVCRNGTQKMFETPRVAGAVDTTGAGDSFNGAFLAEYLQSGDLERSVRAGQACAGEVICHYGAII